MNVRLCNQLSWFLFLTISIFLYKGLYEYIAPFVFSIVSFGIIFLLIGRYKKISYCLMFVYTLIIGFQVAMLCNTEELLMGLVLENVDTISSLNRDIICLYILVCLGYLFVLIILHCFSFPFNRLLVRTKTYACIYVLVVLGIYCLGLFDGMVNRLPVTSVIKSFYGLISQMSYTVDEKVIWKQKNLYGKKWVYKNKNEDNIPNLKNKNIITLFTEGMALNVIDKFNTYPNLTPNISRFMDKGVWFDNYYNHTATTYRGIRGQLTSSYQYKGVGYYENEEMSMNSSSNENKVINLVSILKDKGYHTYFLSAHLGKHKFNDYIKRMGFDKVFVADDFINEDNNLADSQLFESLRKLMSSGELKEPYFIATYNWGTHYNEKSPYWIYLKNGKEVNELVNVMHNYDIEFGKFINWFDSSAEINDNTYIILTSDHMTYPDKVYVDTFNDKIRLLNCITGRIPLILYGKDVEHKVIDAKGKNSLDFAPTLLNWLRINDAKNYFLGCSLYDEKCHHPFEYIYAMSDFYYYNNCYPVQPIGRGLEYIKKIKDFYNFSNAL